MCDAAEKNQPSRLRQILDQGVSGARVPGHVIINSDVPWLAGSRALVYQACANAAPHSDGECLALLLLAGARPTTTALYAAADHGSAESVEMLLDAGLLPSQRASGRGDSAEEAATRHGHAACAAVLRRRRAFEAGESGSGAAAAMAAALSGTCIPHAVLPEGVVEVVAEYACFIRNRHELLFAAHCFRRDDATAAA